jgi:hypothetical protein
MKFKRFIQKTEMPLPGVGLFRSHRDPVMNHLSYQEAVTRRDIHCFNHSLSLRCETYKKYKLYVYHTQAIRALMSLRLNADVSDYIFGFYDVIFIEYLPIMEYRIIKPKLKYKWYIIISNLLYLIKEEYHTRILDISFRLTYNTFDEVSKLFFREFGSIVPIREDTLTKTYVYEDVFDLANQVRDDMRFSMLNMYFAIRL